TPSGTVHRYTARHARSLELEPEQMEEARLHAVAAAKGPGSSQCHSLHRTARMRTGSAARIEASRDHSAQWRGHGRVPEPPVARGVWRSIPSAPREIRRALSRPVALQERLGAAHSRF